MVLYGSLSFFQYHFRFFFNVSKFDIVSIFPLSLSSMTMYLSSDLGYMIDHLSKNQNDINSHKVIKKKAYARFVSLRLSCLGFFSN